MRRKITHGRKAGEKLARRWLREAGIPRHFVGFSEDCGYYLIIDCLISGRVCEFRVPCWGARVLRGVVNNLIQYFRVAEIVDDANAQQTIALKAARSNS